MSGGSSCQFPPKPTSLNAEGTWKAFLPLIKPGIKRCIPRKIKEDSSKPRWYNTEVRKSLRRQRAYPAKMKKVRADLSAEDRKLLIKKYKLKLMVGNVTW
jgi:hypothetical protein